MPAAPGRCVGGGLDPRCARLPGRALLSGAKAGVTYGGHGVWSFHTREKRFLNDHKYVPMDWWEALRLPGAWDYGYARWLFETFGLADLVPNQALVANADTAIRAAATDDAGVVAVYMPQAVGLAVNADLSRHRITPARPRAAAALYLRRDSVRRQHAAPTPQTQVPTC